MPLTQVSSRLIEDTLRYVLGANGTSDYTFTGKGLTGAVNDPTLTLSRGHTYVFENRNSANAHPFYIKTSIANGGTNDAYNTGVTNNGGAGGTEIVFTVPHDAPDLLYYQCSSHSSMAGQLKIAGAVADGSITESKLADDAVTADKLANSINSAIAANTAKDLTALSASNLTSGTVPDARFPATLPAASAANLTSIPAANLTGALPAISGASLTGISSDYVKLQHNSTAGGSYQYLVFNNLDVATYKYFDLTISLIPETDNKVLRFRFRQGTGSSTSGNDVIDNNEYHWSYLQHWGTDNFGELAKTSQVSATLTADIGNNTSLVEGAAITMRIHLANSNDTQAARLQNWLEWSFANRSPDSNISQGRGTAMYTGLASDNSSILYPTGFQLYMSSGAINAHTYTLYGKKR